MRLQLWSYNYEPEPTGIAPLSATWARAMTARGHDISVVSAHPHYPEPRWGTRALPYREVRDGIRVLRLPLWIGRATTAARVRQEASYAAALAAALPLLGRPDAIVAVSPCFPALLPAMAGAGLRRIPWVLWLQDILPDGAAATRILEDGTIIRAARKLELAAYRSAARIVVISDVFTENLVTKGVPPERITRIDNVASRPLPESPRPQPRNEVPRVLTIGNIGRTQDLAAVVEAFEGSEALARVGALLVVTGEGVAADEVRDTIRTERVAMPGLLDSQALEAELLRADVALVSQRTDVAFNVPSKLMNYMAYGLPTVASVRADSEVARVVTESGGGWVATGPRECAERLAWALERPEECRERGEAAWRYAREHFTPESAARAFEAVLEAVVGDREGPKPRRLRRP